jgi:acylphosphatase
MRRVAFRVTGLVQGVFFRATTAEVAQREGVTGWIANRPDGAVEGEAQGPPAAVEALVAFLRQGPPRARVADVVVEERDTVEGEAGFAVR